MVDMPTCRPRLKQGFCHICERNVIWTQSPGKWYFPGVRTRYNPKIATYHRLFRCTQWGSVYVVDGQFSSELCHEQNFVPLTPKRFPILLDAPTLTFEERHPNILPFSEEGR